MSDRLGVGGGGAVGWPELSRVERRGGRKKVKVRLASEFRKNPFPTHPRATRLTY